MADCMSYPKEPMEFIKGYSFVDSDEVYTNGSELVPVFRVEQMLEHYIHTGICKDTNVRSNDYEKGYEDGWSDCSKTKAWQKGE